MKKLDRVEFVRYFAGEAYAMKGAGFFVRQGVVRSHRRAPLLSDVERSRQIRTNITSNVASLIPALGA
jgi:hypothetical protein